MIDKLIRALIEYISIEELRGHNYYTHSNVFHMHSLIYFPTSNLRKLINEFLFERPCAKIF